MGNLFGTEQALRRGSTVHHLCEGMPTYHVFMNSVVFQLLDKIGSNIGGESSGDFSGWSVSMSADGTRVAIGSPFRDGAKGHVRVYELESFF